MNFTQQYFLAHFRRYFNQGLLRVTRHCVFECSASVTHVGRPPLFHRGMLTRPHCIMRTFYEDVGTAPVRRNAHCGIGPPPKYASEGGELYRQRLYRSRRPPGRTTPGPGPMSVHNNSVTPEWHAHRPRARASVHLCISASTSERQGGVSDHMHLLAHLVTWKDSMTGEGSPDPCPAHIISPHEAAG